LGSGGNFSSRDRFLPIYRVVPTFVAMSIASLAGWLVQSPVSAILGPIPAVVVSLVVAAVAFFFAKRFLSDLRGGS
jgi:F0F1-type ATP synthase assembly protein I